ncbi:MAG: hypothetical protein ACLRMG_00030 [Clostridium sp.]
MLVKCKNCGSRYSEYAEKCPKCNQSNTNIKQFSKECYTFSQRKNYFSDQTLNEKGRDIHLIIKIAVVIIIFLIILLSILF